MMHQCNVTTVQRAIHKLTKAGLVIPRDRGGRRRCGTRADDGGAHDVYGFDLSPLIVRAADCELCAKRPGPRRVRIGR